LGLQPFLLKLSEAFYKEQHRWFLWWPVGMGLGIILYFQCPHEPSFALSLFPIAFLAFLIWKTRIYWLIALLSIAIGFGLAKVRTSFLDTIMLNGKHKNVHFKACVHDVEQKKMENHYKLRLVLDHVESELILRQFNSEEQHLDQT
jgi:hypothetical protein